MAAIRAPEKAKLIVGLLSGEEDWLREGVRRLKRHFGDVDVESDVWPFDATDYYAIEMGERLFRKFVSFDELTPMDRLAEVKRLTNDLEAALAADLVTSGIARPVNLDPGYVTLSKLVLASSKDFSHRIYLERGVFAEVTLLFEHGGWRTLPWTYPDYGGGQYDEFLNEVRESLKRKRSQFEK